MFAFQRNSFTYYGSIGDAVAEIRANASSFPSGAEMERYISIRIDDVVTLCLTPEQAIVLIQAVTEAVRVLRTEEAAAAEPPAFEPQLLQSPAVPYERDDNEVLF